MLHTIFQASEQSGSEEDFCTFFDVFIWLEPTAILDPTAWI